MRYQVYEPDTLDFDFSGIVGTIGSGIVSAGKSLVTNILTKQNIQTVVSGIVAKQVQAKQPVSYAPPQTAAGFTRGEYSILPYSPVSSPQPIIVSGGGGGVPYSVAAPPSGGVFGIHPAYLIAGVAALALILRR